MGKEKNSNKTYTLTKVLLIVIAVILVATLSLVFIQSSGLIIRANTVLESENYKVSGTMMQYMVNAQYQSFYSSYGAYLSSFGIKTAESLKHQKFDTSNYFVSMILGNNEEYKDFEGTWYDYFWKTAEDQMKNTLVFCEAAKKANITLGDEEKAKIDEAIQNIYKDMEAINEENRAFYEKNYGQKNYVTFNTVKDYLSASYGQGVKISDIRKVLELYSISEKYYNEASEKMLEDLKANSTEILNYYNDNKSEYYKADYLSFTFSASYTKPSDSTKVDATWKTYLEKVNKALDNAKALSECETEEEFKTFMIKYWFEDKWQTQYDKTIAELKKKKVEDGGIRDSDIPEESVRNEKKAKVLEQIIDGLLNGKKEKDLAPIGKTAFDGAIDAIKNSLYGTLSGPSYYAGLEKLKGSYDDSSDAGKWLFAEDRKPGDNKYFANHDAEFIGTETEAPATTTAPETTTAPSTEAAPATTEAPSTEAAPTAETAPATTAATSTKAPETTPAEPNWEIELDKEKSDDAKFSVEVRFVIKPRYIIEDKVREFGHILVSGEPFIEEDKNLSEDEALKKAKEKADQLCAELKAGTVTKESFEALALKNTEDSGVFYDEVAPNDMVKEVNAWLFDEARKAGDIEVVESEYGYHVMYFVEVSEDASYYVEARDDLYAEKIEAWAEDCEKTYGVEVKADYVKNNMTFVAG